MANPALLVKEPFIPDVYEDETGRHVFASNLPQEKRIQILNRHKELDKLEKEWIAKGGPWTDDDEALLNRMSS